MSTARGFVMPAEWLPHEATWLGWPHRTSDWPGKFAAIPWVLAEIVRIVSQAETVRVLVQDARHRDSAARILTRAGVDLARVEFHHTPTDRGWMRDSGPLFVVRQGHRPARAIARFRFNGWGKYPEWRHDDRVPERAARALGVPLRDARLRGRGVVLEGGAIDVDGRGTILATEECLLDPTVQVRNPGWTRRDYERVFRTELGATHTVWLGRGIVGDDTHGHVDDVARFVGRSTIVLCRERDSADPNHAALEDNRERLEEARLADGSRPDVVFLPMPRPVWFAGQRLPASYANFYVSNAAVVVPTFNDPADREALGILGELFRDRPVVGVHARDLVWGLGTVHCLTQQEPAI